MLAAMAKGATTAPAQRTRRSATGIAGLDRILPGGLPEGWMYAVQGEPGVGKTTLGLQFLLAGAEAGERTLYVTLSHTASELDAIARSHGWSIEGTTIHEFSALEASDGPGREQTVFSPEEVAFGELADSVVEAIRRADPQRVVIDGIEGLRLLSDRPQRYRRQLLLITQALRELDCCTTVFLTDVPGGPGDRELEAMVHGVVQLERHASASGSIFRRLQVTKGRGMAYTGGYHTFRIATGGIEVYPRVHGGERTGYDAWRPAPSEVPGLDELLGGGLEHGTTCLFLGAAGTGKSSLVSAFAVAAAGRGDRSAVFLTDERPESYVRRARGLGIDLGGAIEGGRVRLLPVTMSDLPHGAFADTVRTAVEEDDVTVVAIDSLTGYLAAIEEEGMLLNQVHELFAYLADRGVLTMLAMSEAGLVGGGGGIRPHDISHIADTVLLLRHFEAEGRLRRAASVLKKRQGPHDDAVRELVLSEAGIVVGPSLASYASVLSGAPRPATGASTRAGADADG